jgi:TonB family protein
LSRKQEVVGLLHREHGGSTEKTQQSLRFYDELLSRRELVLSSASPLPVAAPSQSPESEKPELSKIVDGERIYSLKELDKRTVIKNRPAPGYTREARRHSTRGIVILRAILASNGSVTHIEVIKGLPHGLSEKAVEAAKKIKFEPGEKDGKPASIRVELEYHFNLY